MGHIATKTLQRYLNAAADPAETAQVARHLAGCSRCGDLLAELAAEDACLTKALVLTAAEADWIAAQDLTGPVLRQIASPTPRLVWALLLAGALLLGVVASWFAQGVAGLLIDRLLSPGPVGFAVDLSGILLPILWRGLLYVADGGLLVPIWPALAAGAAIWLWSRRTRGELHHA